MKKIRQNMWVHVRESLFCIMLCLFLLTGSVYAAVSDEKDTKVIREELGYCRHDIEYITKKLWINYKEEKQQEIYKEQRKLDQWRLVLVNFEHSLDKEYEVELTKVENGQYVDVRIADALNAMLDAALEEGIDICVVSGYRSYERQVKLYNNKVRRLKRQGYAQEEAEKEAATVVAFPGTSEHMTGLAVDLVTAEDPRLEEFQEDTRCYQWMVAHCAEYGFIVRYPEGKSDITGIIYEPWHFRYVGKEHARIIMDNNWCLEEYMEANPELLNIGIERK